MGALLLAAVFGWVLHALGTGGVAAGRRSGGAWGCQPAVGGSGSGSGRQPPRVSPPAAAPPRAAAPAWWRAARPTPVVLTAGAALTAPAVIASVGDALSFTTVTAGAEPVSRKEPVG